MVVSRAALPVPTDFAAPPTAEQLRKLMAERQAPFSPEVRWKYSNLALAVGPGIRYVVVPGGPAGAADVHHTPDGVADDPLEATAHRYLLAEDLLAGYAKDLGYESPDAARGAVLGS